MDELPQMELRFANLSLSAEFTVAGNHTALPSIPNHLKQRFATSVVTKPILKNLSGVFEPGTMTLVPGQPGSGKSSLLKVLSGRFPMAKNIRLGGEILYNGQPHTALAKTLPQCVAYVTQQDIHLPTLTVKETLAFAHTFSGGGAVPSDLEYHESTDAAAKLYADMPSLVVQQFGLQHCQDTVVGDVMLRGISGGAKKRVTADEMEFGNKFVTLLDEISTGLDSAATLDLISRQRRLATTFRKTVVIALLQPAPEVVELFDNVVLLNDGDIVYFGPRDRVQTYFYDLGIACPPRRDLADFLVDLGTDRQQRYVVSSHCPVPRRPAEFADLFEHSDVHRAMLAQLHAPHDPRRLQDHDHHVTAIPEFHQSFTVSTLTLMQRQWLVTRRNTAFLNSKAVLIVVMALLYGSAFYQFDVTKIQVAMGIIFFAVLYLALGQTPMLPIFFQARAVFYKQRRANFFRTSSYVLAMSMSQIPLVLGETLVFGGIVYALCGFVPTVGAFLASKRCSSSRVSRSPPTSSCSRVSCPTSTSPSHSHSHRC